MARKMRSFRKGNDALGVIVNNSLVARDRRKRAAKRDEEARQKRNERELKLEEARLARAREREKIRAEKEIERQKKAEEKFNAKAEAVFCRLETEMEKLGLYPGKKFLVRTTIKAVKSEITPAKVRRFCLEDDKKEIIQEVSFSCGEELLEKSGITSEYKVFEEYPNLLRLVGEYRPQIDVRKDVQYKKYIKGLKEKFRKLKEREVLIAELLSQKSMFKDEIEEFAVIIEKNDWGRNESEISTEYAERINNKKNYVLEVKSKIKPIKIR